MKGMMIGEDRQMSLYPFLSRNQIAREKLSKSLDIVTTFSYRCISWYINQYLWSWPQTFDNINCEVRIDEYHRILWVRGGRVDCLVSWPLCHARTSGQPGPFSMRITIDFDNQNSATKTVVCKERIYKRCCISQTTFHSSFWFARLPYPIDDHLMTFEYFVKYS